MLGIFCYIKDELNVVLPYLVVGVKINPTKKEDVTNFILSKLNNINNLEDIRSEYCYEIIRALRQFNYTNRIKKKKPIQVYFREIGKFEVEKYGVNSAFYREVNYLSNLDDEVIVSTCNPNLNNFNNKVKYVVNYTEYIELIIGLIFSKVRRDYYLSSYYCKGYSALKINRGKLDKWHIRRLKKVDRLPDFYNESYVVNYFYEHIKVLPKWCINNDSITK